MDCKIIASPINCHQRKRLGVVGEIYNVKLGTEAKLLIKSLKFIQMLNSKSQAGTAAESSTNVEISTSSPNNAKPNVGGSFSHP